MLSTPTDIGVSSPQAMLTMLHLTDSALPTGGFSHSLGLESYLQRDIVNSPETFSTWMYAYIRQSSFNDALVAKLSAEAARQPHEDAIRELKQLDTLAHTTPGPPPDPRGKCLHGAADVQDHRGGRPRPPTGPVVRAGRQRRRSLRLPRTRPRSGTQRRRPGYGNDCAQLLMQTTASLTQNAIRGIPIGQNAGQKVLVGSYPVIEEAVQLTMQHGYLDLGAAAPGLEIAQMQHENLRSRMFMS